MGRIGGKAILIFLAFAAATVFLCRPGYAAVGFYAADWAGGHLYSIDKDTWAATDLGGIINSPASPNYNYSLSMDYDPNGGLHILRARTATQTSKPGEIYSLDVNTLIATQEYYLGTTGSGLYDAGLAFRNDNRFYVNKKTTQSPILLDDIGTDFSAQSFTQSGNYAYPGIEWYDDGTVNGQLYAITPGYYNGVSTMILDTININYAGSGYSVSFYPTATGLFPGYTTSGDLAISGDVLYIMVTNATSSKLYSYDLSGGPNGSYSFLADYPNNRFSALAAVPQTNAAPEPGSIVLLGMGLAGLVTSRRRKKTA
ncbi:MAG: PEP-CTERM sorting domain-containing protein [Candidatus Omnitrophica bacterium]|nr:PEP-CTERM sorting domain-containing protein [Candidatus Omnitrophota bacterium]